MKWFWLVLAFINFFVLKDTAAGFGCLVLSKLEIIEEKLNKKERKE